MRADARRFANHRDIKMRKSSAAGAHPIDRKGEEAIG